MTHATDETRQETQQQRWNHDITRALIGGLITLGIGGGAIALLGTTNFYEARRLIESVAAVLPFLGSAGIAASTTVLALMVTLLGISARSETRLAKVFYQRIRWIGRLASVLFGVCVLLLVLLAAPLAEAEPPEAGRTLVVAQFYITAGIVAAAAGMFTSMIMMLQSTLSDLVIVLGMRRSDHYIVASSKTGEVTES